MILDIKDREDFKIMRKKLFFGLSSGVMDNNDIGVMTATLISKIMVIGQSKDLLSKEELEKLDDCLGMAIRVGNSDDITG
jgi:hypothetical protein